jgi:saccharopine dehydrogenase (NAD+, L-lysine-forming)
LGRWDGVINYYSQKRNQVQMKIGIIREEKNPPDSRVTLSPEHCKILIDKGLDVVVQPSRVRCFSDDHYLKIGIPMSEDLSDRTLLIGVKEVPIDALIPNKTYFFFSHTFKAQPYNQKLLKAIVDKNITLIDYEVLTNDSGARVIAFGKFAGMVGAHNALWTYGMRTGAFELPRMSDLFNYKAAKEVYEKIKLPNVKVVLTGTGRVAQGSVQVLNDMGLTKIRPIDYVRKTYDNAVYTQLNSFYYAKRKDGRVFDDVQDYYKNPKDYDSDFNHFLPMSDIMINGIYWDNDAPAFFTVEEMASEDFNIKVIADVTCDIAPTSSIPSTLRASTIADPVFGFNPESKSEMASFQSNGIDMMFIAYIIPELLKEESEMLTKATIVTNKNLGPHFEYLRDYLNGK